MGDGYGARVVTVVLDARVGVAAAPLAADAARGPELKARYRGVRGLDGDA